MRQVGHLGLGRVELFVVLSVELGEEVLDLEVQSFASFIKSSQAVDVPVHDVLLDLALCQLEHLVPVLVVMDLAFDVGARKHEADASGQDRPQEDPLVVGQLLCGDVDREECVGPRDR